MATRDRIGRVASRFTRRTPRPSRPTPALSRAPWWVRTLTTAGRPIVAVIVLIMCAPGEHHLAVLAGWDGRLAWGMAAALAAYAGIAAAVASRRPKGAPGRVSAIVGAWLSLGAAMAAQPISHAFVTGHLSADPRAPLWLVIGVSCVPPLVLGHLLHLAATPVTVAAAAPAEQHPAPIETSETPTETSADDSEPAEADTAYERWTAQARATGAFPHSVPDPDTAETPAETAEHHSEPAPEQRLLTTREVADRYGVSVSTVRTWKDRARIAPAVTDAALGNLYDPETLPASH